jgi:hypothetical protein
MSVRPAPPRPLHRSTVSQFPKRTPSFFAPLTRWIPAAGSGLSSPQSAASKAKRLTAARRRLIVDAERASTPTQSGTARRRAC